MTYPNGLYPLACSRPQEPETIRPISRNIETTSPPPKSILYLHHTPPSLDSFIPPKPIGVSAKGGPASGGEGMEGATQAPSIDWGDVLGWSLTLAAGVASGLLITYGYQNENNEMAASGTALGTSAFMWGVCDAAFRGAGIPHDGRGLRLGISLGTGVLTGVSTWLALRYNTFDFSLEGKQFKDDKEAPRVIPRDVNTLKNPTSEWGP